MLIGNLGKDPDIQFLEAGSVRGRWRTLEAQWRKEQSTTEAGTADARASGSPERDAGRGTEPIPL